MWFAKFEILRQVFVRVQVCTVSLCVFGRVLFVMDCLILKTKAVLCFETSRITQPTTQLQIQEEVNLRVTWRRTGPSVCFGRRNHVSLKVRAIWFIALCLHIYIYTHTYIHKYATGWTIRGSNPGGGEIFRTRPDRPWGPLSPYTMGNVSFPEVKRPGRGVDNPPSSAEVKERVELYLYSPPGPSWPALGWTLPMPITDRLTQHLCWF